MDIVANPALDAVIEAALAEDLAHGDPTTDMTVAPKAQAVGRAVARKTCIVAGTTVFERVFNKVDPYVSVSIKVPDGTTVGPDEEIAVVAGKASSILAAERVALNFLQHLSGIATLTREYVKRVPEGSKTRIADTRKTTPGLRALEKHAVRCGGGINHRSSLGGGILIKDNHIAIAGSVAQAVASARASMDPSHRVEVEAGTLDEVDEAIAAGAEVILLDNMSSEKVALAVQRIAGRALIEVSGNVSLDDVTELAVSGIDFISVGALTHSAPSCDIGLDSSPREET
ncbi:MAG: carboxylating nicotinate-nucleotide diphosphorylase [Deltaproteobacteria bacterium]|nr:carboxylating nicotinate-nucleotide diphosphorylase [Deltaproteobacteria bacterium]